MVRNMIREDVTSSLVKSPIGRFFDNIFVLVTLLALIIVFGVWMKRRSVTHPDDQLKMARSILEKEPSYAWLRARDEMLQPLLDSNALPASKQEIEAMIAWLPEQYVLHHGAAWHAAVTRQLSSCNEAWLCLSI